MAGTLGVADTDGMTAHVSPAVIRQWARNNGLTVGERGRLSPQIRAAYATCIGSSVADVPRAARSAAGPAQRAPGAVLIRVRPAPGATGIGHQVAARSA